MAIDILTERIFPLDQIPPEAIPGRSGRPVSRYTIDNWRREGIRGVFLETLMVGGRRVTSLEALARFYTAVSEVKNGYEGRPTFNNPRTEAQRNRAAKTAMKELGLA